MNSYEQELRSQWKNVTYHAGGSLKLSFPHPLSWHVGYFTPEHKSVIMISPIELQGLKSSRSIYVKCGERLDGQYAVSFTLMSRDKEDVFVTMWADIIRFSGEESDQQNALKKVVQRYAAWRQLLERKNTAILGIGAQKGLIGELLYLKSTIEGGMEISAALSGWVGPDGADQDFVYDDGWHEIKSAGIASQEITISSIEQLDSDEIGELIVMRIDQCAPAKKGAFTLNYLVRQLWNMVRAAPGAEEQYWLKLAAVGYIEMSEYDEKSFVRSDVQKYRVDQTFPRITRKLIPVEVANAEYELNLASLSDWAV